MFVDLIKLLRPMQWYKNLVIYLALIFTKNLFNLDAFLLVTLGFISLCLISSANYIINDIVDRKKDQIHPEKKHRPIASGKITIPLALIIAGILLIISLAIPIINDFDHMFTLSIISLFLLTNMYSFWLKNEVFIDIIMISANFVIRAVSGVFIIKSPVSSWIILCPFFLALFLATAKRHADIILLKEKQTNHKEVLKHYTKEITTSLMIITITLLIISYSLYIFSTGNNFMFYTLPFVLYCVFRWFMYAFQGSNIARHPEMIITDIRFIISFVIAGIIIFLNFYHL